MLHHNLRKIMSFQRILLTPFTKRWLLSLLFPIMVTSSFIGIYAFLASNIEKSDVSDSVVVPENYENLLVLDVTIPSAKSGEKDILLHNGQAGSSIGDTLSSFSPTDWYLDHNGNLQFDGNEGSKENEATISSNDELLDSNDVVKNTGLAFIKAFKYSAGVFEQYIDSDHSNSYTPGEAVVRTSTSAGVIHKGEVVRSGSADMTPFPSYVRFIDSIQGELSPTRYDDGEAIILDAEPLGILSDADTVLTEGSANLKPFPNEILYSDSNNNGRYSAEEAIILDSGTPEKLDASDKIIRAGASNLTRFSDELYADSDGDDTFDAGELIVDDASKDGKIQPDEVRSPGTANLRPMAGDSTLFADANSDGLFDANELIVKNATIPDILEPADAIIKPGNANLKPFDLEQFVDNNKNATYDDGECIIRDDGIKGVVEPGDIEKPGTANLQSFSNKGYLFTDADGDGRYTGDHDIENGYQGEAIFRDANGDSLIGNGELVIPGYASIKPFPMTLRFIDIDRNGRYDLSESAIMSSDNLLSGSDIIVRPGPAYLSAFPENALKWVDDNNNDKYDEDELITSSTDEILSSGEVIKSGLCGLRPFPDEYRDYVYSDVDGNSSYSKDPSGAYELIISSDDKILDAEDSVVKPGTARLLSFSNTPTMFVDENRNKDFDPGEAIVDDSYPNGNFLLDDGDRVVRSGVAMLRNFEDRIVYIDHNNDTYFHGDSDYDVLWKYPGDPTYANDPNITNDQDEVVLDDPIGAEHFALDTGDRVLRPGLARLSVFSNAYAFTDDGNGEYDGDDSNEAIVFDNDHTLDSTDEVLVTGRALIRDFDGERFIDDGHDWTYSSGEAIWRDSGSREGLLDPDDEIVKPGRANLLPMNIYRYLNDGIHSSFSGSEAIIVDNPPYGILDRGDVTIHPGEADVKDFNPQEKYVDCNGSGNYTDGEPIVRGSSGEIINPGTLANFTDNVKYIDSDGNNLYSTAEAIIEDRGQEGMLDVGLLDGEDGHDLIIVPGVANLKNISKLIGVSFDPPFDNPEVVTYLDSTNLGALDDHEALIIDNPPLGILDTSDEVIGKIDYNDGYTYHWSANPTWRVGMRNFGASEKFLTNGINSGYSGQPVINESTGDIENVWDASDLVVYDGSISIPPRGLSDNWEETKYIDDDHDGNYDTGECILDFSSTPPGADVSYTDIIVTQGRAGITAFPDSLKFADDDRRNNSYDPDEALVNDANNNDMLDPGEVVSAGLVSAHSLASPVRYIDANMDGNFSSNEAIIRDGGGTGGSPNGLLDAGALGGTGIDEVLDAGVARLATFNRAEKFVDGNTNGIYDPGEAVVFDWYAPGTFVGEFILSGDHRNRTGSLTYLAPGSRMRDCILLPSEPGMAGMRELNDREEYKYTDRNLSLSYDGFYSPIPEAIIYSADDILSEGKLDGTGTDKVLAGGETYMSPWDTIPNYSWSDDNNDSEYQSNEAVVFDADGDGIIESIGAGGDRVVLPGDAMLRDFAHMKYIDVNNNAIVDIGGELIANDANNDNKLENGEISDPGPILSLRPFTSTDYKYCDWNNNGSFDPQLEAVVYTKDRTLDPGDEILAPGYPELIVFDPQPMFIDHDNDNNYDEGSAIIYSDGDQILENEDEIIAPGFATSFDGTSFKYSAMSSEQYSYGLLIINDSNGNDILEEGEIVTAGAVSLTNFNPATDAYADSNHNGRYDYKGFGTGFGEAIVNVDEGEIKAIKTAGYAGLRTFDGTSYKYSDAGARDLQYTYGELIVNDINNDDKVSANEIVCVGAADLKVFPPNVMFSDSDRDGKYSDSEAVVLTEDNILQSKDIILIAGDANLKMFATGTYRFADADHNGTYSEGEVILVASNWGTVDDILEDSDIIVLEGSADIEQFPSNFMFLDDIGDSNAYEDGEAIVNDSNNNGLLDTDEIVTAGRASLVRFASTEKYTDGGDGGNSRNSKYDPEEAIIRDGNADGKLSAGPLDGTGTDTVLAPGRAGLTRFAQNERYVDANNNGQYDGNEDIYLDVDGNGVVTGEGSDSLRYFVVENRGTATSSDLKNVKLWADRDSDGRFEPDTDDAPVVKLLIPDPNNPKIWYEGPASAPPLSINSARSPIGYPIPPDGQRFFVTVDISNNPTDARSIQMGLPLNGVRTLYGSPGPSDIPIFNAYTQMIDFANPTVATITSPEPGALVFGQVTLKADAFDSVGVGKVEFYDGVPSQSNHPIAEDDNGPPWEALWDCSNAGFGPHTLYARVYDSSYLKPPKNQVIKHYKDSPGVPVIVGMSFSVPLSTGWNFVSIPLEPFDPSFAEILSAVDGVESIWTYDAEMSKWFRFDMNGPPFLNDLNAMRPGVGYLILMSRPGVLNVSGTPVGTTIQLKGGWNLVGYNSLNPMDIASAILSISANHPSVWTYDAEADAWLNYDPEDPFSDLDVIEPGRAYWIHVEGNCTWDIGFQQRVRR